MTDWIWQSAAWPDFRHDPHTLAPAVSAARRAQGEILGLLQALGEGQSRDVEARIWEAESLATAAIEGEHLDLASLRSSIARRLGIATPLQAPARMVDGLLDMQEDAATRWDRPLTLERLCGWHAALFPTGYSGLHPVAAGKLRSAPEAMQIVSGPMHNPKVHYVAPPADRVPAEVGRFLAWFNDESRTQDGLFRAGIAHLWFEIIHPFEDGNGRIGRAIVDLALAQDLRGHPRIYSLAAEMAGTRSRYYEELQRASRADADINRWLVWFCEVFTQASLRSKSVALSALAKARFWADHGGTPVTEAQAKVVNRLLDAGPRGFEGDLTTRKYVALTGLSRATAYRDLAALVGAGMLASRGQGKATRYFVNLPGWEPPP
jgi:hypothetical protein